MTRYTLYGLAEGLAGVSHVWANSVDDVFAKYPNLYVAKDKMKVNGTKIGIIHACDG